jgi:hypothetical protein
MLSLKLRGQDGNERKIGHAYLFVSGNKYTVFSQKFHTIAPENTRFTVKVLGATVTWHFGFVEPCAYR